MSILADVFASVRLNLETGEFEASAAKAADAAGTTMSQRIGSKLKTGLAVGLAAGFGLATKQLVELDNATAKFTADTGATEAQAKAAGKAINDMAGKNLQPIKEIGAVLAAVTTNMGLQGQAAADLTQKILTYATATGQDAVAATGVMDDLMDRLGISVNDLATVMDTLIANTHKYGGSVKVQQQALADLAPVLTATNASWQDGVAILGFFEKAGIDSATAATGLNKAVKELKPGQGLQDLFDKLSAIPSPADRAREATRLFGRSAGPELAKVLGEGSVDLKSFGLSWEETAGATDKAGEAITGTIQNKIVLGLKQLGSTAAEVLGSAGPLATGLASIVSLGGPVMASLLMMVTGTETLSGAMAALWITLAPVTVALLAIAGVIVTVAAVQQVMSAKTAEASATYVESTRTSMEATRLAADGMDIYRAAWGQSADVMVAAGHTAEEAAASLKKFGWTDADIAELKRKSMTLGEAIPGGLAAGVRMGEDQFLRSGDDAGVALATRMAGAATKYMPRVGEDAGVALAISAAQSVDAHLPQYMDRPGEDAGARLASRLAETVDAKIRNDAKWAAIGQGIPSGIGKGIAEKSQLVQTGMDVLLDILKNGLTPAHQAAIVSGRRYIADFRRGLHSGIPGASQQAKEVGIAAIVSLNKASPGSRKAGQYYSDLLGSGMSDHQIQTALKAAHVGQAAINKMRAQAAKANGPKAVGKLYDDLLGEGMTGAQAAAVLKAGGVSSAVITSLNSTAGVNGAGVINAWSASMDPAWAAAGATLDKKLAWFRRRLHGQSPPPEGPLKDIDKGARNIANAWVDNFIRPFVTGAGALHDALSLYSMVGVGVPGLGPSIGASQAAVSGAGSSSLRDITVNVAGLIRAETPEDIARALRRNAGIGVF